MADITMCENKECPKKNNCYRYTAKPSHYGQSYFSDNPCCSEDGCLYYWEVE